MLCEADLVDDDVVRKRSRAVVVDSDEEGSEGGAAGLTAMLTARQEAAKLASTERQQLVEREQTERRMAEFMDTLVPITGDLAAVQALAEAELNELRSKYDDDPLFSDPLFSDFDDNPIHIGADTKSRTAVGTLRQEEEQPAERTAELAQFSDNDDDLNYDSDGNAIPDEPSRPSYSKYARESADGDDGVEVGDDGVSERPKKNKGASKREMLEMRMTSERLQRANFVELPARRGNLDINQFLALYNIQRPSNKGTNQTRSGDSDAEDGDYRNSDSETEQAEASECILAHSVDISNEITSTMDATDQAGTAAVIETEALHEEPPAAESTSERPHELRLEPVLVQLVLPQVPIKVDAKITKSQLTYVELSNRALIRTQMAQQRAISLLQKRHGKGRELTMDERQSLEQYDVILLDDEIEIVDFIQPKQTVAATTAAGLKDKTTLQEKNRRLKALAAAQNRTRREEEAREYAEALEAKKRKREEKKAARMTAAGGSENEDSEEQGEGEMQFKRIQRIKKTFNDVDNLEAPPSIAPTLIVPSIAPTLPLESMASTLLIGTFPSVLQHSQTLSMNWDDGDDDDHETQKPLRRSKSNCVIDDDDRDKPSERLISAGSDVDMDEAGSDVDKDADLIGLPDSIRVQIDAEGFVVGTGNEDIDWEKDLASTQQLLSAPSLPPTQDPHLVQQTHLNPKAAKPGTLLHFLQKRDQSQHVADPRPAGIQGLPAKPSKRSQMMKSRSRSDTRDVQDSGDGYDAKEAKDTDMGMDEGMSGGFKEFGASQDLMGLLSGVFPTNPQQATADEESERDDLDENTSETGLDGSEGADGDDGNDADEEGENNDNRSSDGADSDEEMNEEDGGEGQSKNISATAPQEQSPTRDMTRVLMNNQAARAQPQPAPPMKSVYVEEEAFEEEDEFFGMGGADGEDKDDGPLVCSGDEDQIEDFTDVIELHRKQIFDEDNKMVENMLNDVTNGNLRKKARRNHFGKGFALSDSEDEEELLRSLRRAGARSSLLSRGGDDDSKTCLEKFASNPKTAPFAKCFVTFDSEDEKGMMSSEEEVLCFSTIKAELAKDLTRRLGRSKKESTMVKTTSFSRTVSSISAVSSVSARNTTGPSKLPLEDNDDDDDIILPKKRAFKPIKGQSLPENEEITKSKQSATSSPIKIDFGKFDVTKLIKPKAPICAPFKCAENDVQPLKYTSRSVAGMNVSFATKARSGATGAFIHSSKMLKSPGTLEKMRNDVVNANGGASWNRASAGGLDAKTLPNSKGSGSGSGNQGFLVGEVAKQIGSDRLSNVVAKNSQPKIVKAAGRRGLLNILK
ncbi:MRC1-like domain-containing protein [Chytriomyces sp. MP71]|nr:MRC1-like domain-containing protein [Chytriomyces sp. MP71]